MTEFNSDLEALIRLCNIQAVEYMNEGLHSEALVLMRKAESYFDHPAAKGGVTREELMGITMTCLGGYYRQMDKYKVAIHYLKQGLSHLQAANCNVKETAKTHISLCAVYSAIGQHATALTEAQAALTLLTSDMPLETAIAYHNTATELEHLGRLKDSLDAYSSGLTIAETHFPGQSIHTSLKTGFESVNRRLKQWNEIARQRRESRLNRRVPTHIAPVRSISTTRQVRFPTLALTRVIRASTSRNGSQSIRV